MSDGHDRFRLPEDTMESPKGETETRPLAAHRGGDGDAMERLIPLVELERA
jgi:hypothetical protein